MKPEYCVLGLMSGTSLDGLDMALCRFAKTDDRWTYEVIAAQTYPYEEALRARLSEATGLNACEFVKLDVELATVMAGAVRRFLAGQVRPDFIASHGHTVFHQPAARLTVQIGSGAVIAALTGITTVCDFRAEDVALGGQGAPLVPAGDERLFGHYAACLNLGGFSNISFRREGRRIAFDISPCNMAFNYLSGQLGMAFDKDGETARRGVVNPALLDRLNRLDYYRRQGAKSLGKEWFDAVFRPCLDDAPLSVADKLRTVAEHVAQQIARAAEGSEDETVLVTGGGARNGFLIERLCVFSKRKLVIPDALTVDFKEAIIFAFLGVLRMRGEVNCLSAITGSNTDHCGGAVYLGNTLIDLQA
ncbi:MAG: anhydro-N-acetylmuramic acid kinase [Tannerella sp.]|jgi:anhydro-N-acetylmuramic acid kinase|nr:anhydro-N-acetylmuramic acid kinase [Tannerella sp.]